MNTNLSKLNKELICVTIGDIEGIGIHLLLKEYKNKKINNFILLTNITIFNKLIKFPKRKGDPNYVDYIIPGLIAYTGYSRNFIPLILLIISYVIKYIMGVFIPSKAPQGDNPQQV